MKHIIPLLVLLCLASCALLDPVDGAPPRVDEPAEFVIDDAGTPDDPADDFVVEIVPSQEERPTTQADVLADTVATAAGVMTGNPMAWYLGAQLLHGAIGLLARKKRKPA
jgi:hypothetical protein